MKKAEVKKRAKPVRRRKGEPNPLNRDGVDWSKIKTVRVSFSGGKDSIALLIWAKENGYFDTNRFERVDVYNYSTCLEWVGLEEYIAYVEKKLDIPITIIRNISDEEIKQTLIKQGENMGVPFFIQYCNATVKTDLIKKYDMPCRYDLIIEGSRWCESGPRSTKTLYNVRDGSICFRPICHWTMHDVTEKIKEYGIKLFWVYQYSERLSCAMCPVGVYKKHPHTLFLVKKFLDKVDIDVYSAWYEAMLKVKWSKMADSKKFMDYFQLFKKNWEWFKRLDPDTYELKVMNIPNCGFWHGPQDN